MRRLLLTLLLACLAYGSGARYFPMVHYSMEEGLPSDNVYDVYRDSKGFLWFSTNKGVARYNGTRFEIFTTADGLPDNDIFFTKEDQGHRLWLATYNGELCYYHNGIFHTAANTPFLRLPFKASHTRYISVQPDSSVTIYFFDQRKFVSIKQDRLRIYDLEPVRAKLNASDLVHICKPSADRFKLIYGDRLVLLDTAGKLLSITSSTHGRMYRYSICQDQEFLYAGDTVFDMQEHVVALQAHMPEGVVRLHADKNGLFVAGYGGLLFNGMQMLPECRVSGCTQDNEGNYWISTLDNGIYYMSRHFSDMATGRNAYTGRVVYAFMRNGYLFFATNHNNLYRYRDGKTVCLFDYRTYSRDADKYAKQPGFIIDDSMRFYSFFREDFFVLANIFGKKARVVQHGRISDDAIKSMCADSRYLYLRRASIIDLVHKDSVLYPDAWHRVKGQDTGQRIFAMAMDENHHVWYTTVGNVYRVTRDTAILQPGFRQLQLKWFDIYNNLLTGYTQDNRLVTGDTGGRYVIHPENGGQNCVWDRMCRLDATHILAATNNLYRVITLPGAMKPATGHMAMAVENPLVPLQAEYVCSDGTTCYFMKNGAVTSIAVANLLQRPGPPIVMFTGVKTKKRHYSTDTVLPAIPFAESGDIGIAFTALSFSGQQLSYEYAISADGTGNWQPIRNEEISLFTPHYGSYTVRVRARTLSGSYSQAATLLLTIEKPYWATWWFIAVTVTAALVLVAFVLYYAVRAVIRRREKAYESRIRFMKSEYKALNALMNPHFIFNSLNNIQSLINDNDRRGANEYLNTFSALVRQNMYNVSRELIPLKKEIELIINYLKLEKLRFKDQLHYTIDIDEGVEAEVVKIPPLLIQPLVENAIRHGLLPRRSPANAVVLRVYEEDNLLHVEVRDNGIGLAQAQKMKDPLHESLGLENIRKRIAQLRMIHGREILFRLDSITDDDGVVAGTVATVIISLTDLL